MLRSFVFAATVTVAALTAASAGAQSSQRSMIDLLKDGYQIADYELGTISINRFQVAERALLVKGASVYTCAFRVERAEAGAEPTKRSICTPIS